MTNGAKGEQVSKQQKLWYLRRLNLFEGLTPTEFEAVAGRLKDRCCARRETVLNPSEPSDRIYLVKDGAVRLYQLSEDGRELTTAVLRRGQMFGTSALIGAGGMPQFAEALENDTIVCEASAEDFMLIMASHPKVAARVTLSLARQLMRAERQIEQLAFQDVPTRVAEVLLEQADNGTGELPSFFTHDEIAKLAGTTRATVTKILNEFVDDGLIELGYRKVRVIDREGLASVANSS